MLSIIITCSHIQSHPSIEVVQKTIESIKNMLTIPPNTTYILAHDSGDSVAYNTYLHSLQNYIKSMPNTRIVKLEQKGYLTGNIKNALRHVDSKYILIVQHDFPFVKEVNIVNVIKDMDTNPTLKHIRFNKRKNLKTGSDALNNLFGHEVHDGLYNTYTRTPSWSDNNHICLTSYYKDIVLRDGGSRFPETSLITKSTCEKIHNVYGTYLYGPVGHDMVIHHIDGKHYKRT
jgi:hypothetical protein